MTDQRRLASLLSGCTATREVDSSAEWAQVMADAEAEGVGPLLAASLSSQPGVELPDAFKSALALVYRRASFVSLRHQAVRQQVCRRLAKRRIPALLLKGAALALTCYDDPVTRPMNDIDLLVPPSRLREAVGCLEEAGLECSTDSDAVGLRSPRGHVVAVHPPTGTVVELHWELKLLGRVQTRATAEIWAGALAAAIDDPSLVMRPGHALPFLCAHMLLQHRKPRLLWLYDLHRLLRGMDATEAALARQTAVRWRLGPCTALALSRVHELFGTPLPEELGNWAREMVTRRDLQARVAAQALSRGTTEAPSDYLMSLLMRRTYSPRSILFPPLSELRLRLGMAPEERVGLSAYAAFLARRLRNGPLHCRQLWRFWRAGAPPPCSRE